MIPRNDENRQQIPIIEEPSEHQNDTTKSFVGVGTSGGSSSQ